MTPLRKTGEYSKIANVLIVDDSYPDIVLVAHSLQRDHVTLNLHSMRSGEELLRYLRAEGDFRDDYLPDLLLLDLAMPAMDGFEVLTELQSDPTLRTIPVIIYSGTGNAADMNMALEMGALGFVSKPLNVNKLRAAVSGIPTLRFAETGSGKTLYRVERPIKAVPERLPLIDEVAL